jgi:hypothetical protein
MHYRVVQDALRTRPFVPFDVVMSNGDRYRVAHPENLMIVRDCLLIPICRRGTPSPDVMADSFVSASYLHIAALERIPAAAEGSGESNPTDRIT